MSLEIYVVFQEKRCHCVEYYLANYKFLEATKSSIIASSHLRRLGKYMDFTKQNEYLSLDLQKYSDYELYKLLSEQERKRF